MHLDAPIPHVLLIALDVRPQESIDINVLSVEVIALILFDALHDRAALELGGPAVVLGSEC